MLGAMRECPITSACTKYYDVGLFYNDLVNLFFDFGRYFHDPPLAHNVPVNQRCQRRLTETCIVSGTWLH